MRWIRKKADERAAGELARALGVHPVVGRLLASRGHATPELAARFLDTRIEGLPDPFLMKGMRAAVDRIVRAIVHGEPVVVYGDYDVDGVTSTSLLVSFLREAGAQVSYYVPHRLVEGYGLNPGAVDRIAAQGARLIVTVDCGVSAVEEVDLAARAGVDVVVVDHHQAPAELPRAAAMLNPHQPGCGFPSKELSAAGVTFHLLIALRKTLRELGRFDAATQPNLKLLLDLVAVGTIADMVPLVGANRILVAHGLQELSRTRRPGLVALKEVADLEGAVTSGQVGFSLGPRINAAGRLDDAGAAVELMLCRDPARARALAEQLDRANRERQEIQKRMVAEALAAAQRKPSHARALVLSSEGWHPGVVGIVATRVVEQFHKPAVILGFDGELAKGSCRSIERFHMYEALGRCASLLVKYGGHHHAAGVQLRRDRLEAFEQAFLAEADRQLTPADLEPVMKVDLDLPAAEASLNLAQELQRLAPFGVGNPDPVFATEVAGVEPDTLVNKKGGTDHLRFRLGNADAIAFQLADRKGLLRDRATVAYTLTVDSFMGRTRASAKVKAIEGRA